VKSQGYHIGNTCIQLQSVGPATELTKVLPKDRSGLYIETILKVKEY